MASTCRVTVTECYCCRVPFITTETLQAGPGRLAGYSLSCPPHVVQPQGQGPEVRFSEGDTRDTSSCRLMGASSTGERRRGAEMRLEAPQDHDRKQEPTIGTGKHP